MELIIEFEPTNLKVYAKSEGSYNNMAQNKLKLHNKEKANKIKKIGYVQ